MSHLKVTCYSRVMVLAWCLLASSAHAQSELPPSLRDNKAPEMLCVPERMWTCNGIGECYGDDRPETLAAWKFDVVGRRWALCKRDGSDCSDWVQLASVNDSAFLIIHDSGWHPEMFKIDRDTGKFASVRISGGFQDLSERPPRTDIKAVTLIQRTGTCFVTQR